MKIHKNKHGVVFNPYQGNFPRILCVCSAGVLRSPTLAAMLVMRGFNARSCGCESYALIPLSVELVAWAHEIFVMNEWQATIVQQVINLAYDDEDSRPLVHVLNVEDDYDYMQPELVAIFEAKIEEFL